MAGTPLWSEEPQRRLLIILIDADFHCLVLPPQMLGALAARQPTSQV